MVYIPLLARLLILIFTCLFKYLSSRCQSPELKLRPHTLSAELMSNATQFWPKACTGDTRQFSILTTRRNMFSLPRELRDFVYELVILRDESIKPCSERTDIMTKAGVPSSLAHTSQMIRMESLPIFLRKKFRATVNMFDTAKIESWFALFSRFDTSGIDLTTTWLRTPQDSSSCLLRKRNLLYLMECGFENKSHVFPPNIHRQWARFPQELGTRTIYLEMFYAFDAKKFLKFQELARLIKILQQKGLRWLDIREIVRLAVDLSDVWQ